MRCFYCENLLPPHASPALNVSSFFFYFNLQNVVRAFLSDPVSIPCFFSESLSFTEQRGEVFFGGGGEKCFTVFAFLEKQDRKLCFLNCGLLYRLLGHNQHTSWGEDFSHSEDPWKLQERRYHVRLDKTAKAATNLYVFISTTPTPAESFIRRGERKGGTNDGRKRTHHSQSAQCCVCWTHTCQRKLALSRPKELLEIRSHRCLVGGFFLIPPRRSKGFLYCSGDFRLLCSKGMRGEEIQPQLQISRDS